MKKNLISLLLTITNCTIQSQEITSIDRTTSIRAFSGQEARKYFNDIAQIRLSLFSQYPYLYKGTLEDERNYLEIYFQSPDAVILLVFDNEKVVGFSNSIPLTQESEEMKTPFKKQGLNLKEYLYVGEVMVYPDYQHKGIARKFFEFHEHKARTQGYSKVVFMTVNRPENHTFKPTDYRSLEPIWRHFGYEIVPGLVIDFEWTQIDTNIATQNCLAIWQKNIIF